MRPPIVDHPIDIRRRGRSSAFHVVFQRLGILVTEPLLHEANGRGVIVQDELCREMPKEMRRGLDPDTSVERRLDVLAQGSERLRAARARPWEQKVRRAIREMVSTPAEI